MLEYNIDHHPCRSGLPPSASAPRRRPPRREMYAEGGIEPRLEDLLADPLTETLMRRDGVSVDSLRQLITTTRRGLLGRAGEP